MMLLFADEVNHISGTKRTMNTGIQGNYAANGMDEPPEKKAKIGKRLY